MADVALPSPPLTREEFDGILAECLNWGRWGAEDQLGALNLITPAAVRRAAALVRSGRTVSCSRELDKVAGPDNPKPVLHHITMLQDADIGDGGDLRFTGDFMGIEMHGDAHSHIDALCHVVYRGLCYNGLPADEVIGSLGARRLSMDVVKAGIVSRGVLIDVPRMRGTRWVQPGEAVMPEEFLAVERATGTQLRKGDILLVRTGHARKRLEEGPWEAAVLKAGLHATVMPLLHARDVAAIGWDGDGEAVPSNCEGVMYPIHTIGVNAMGLYFVDSLNLEELAAACIEENRWEFLCVIAPLRVGAGTASPVNPIAVF